MRPERAIGVDLGGTKILAGIVARDGEIGAQEVDRAKRIFESRWIRQIEDMEGQANYLASWQALGNWRIGDEYFGHVMSCTSRDLTDVANRWLPTTDVGVLLYRPDSASSIAAAVVS